MGRTSKHHSCPCRKADEKRGHIGVSLPPKPDQPGSPPAKSGTSAGQGRRGVVRRCPFATPRRGVPGKQVVRPQRHRDTPDAVETCLDQHDLASSTRRVYRASLASLVAASARRPPLASFTQRRLVTPTDLDPLHAMQFRPPPSPQVRAVESSPSSFSK